MPSAETVERPETVEPASPRNAPPVEQRPPQRDGSPVVLIIGVVGLVTVAWCYLLMLLGSWLIRVIL
jgi:hypothetical protein